MSMNPVTLPVATQNFLSVLQKADINQDQKLSQAEVQQSLLATSSLTAAERPAAQVMNEKFSYFAGNRGLPPDAIRTTEFRVGEDDQIRQNEVLAIANFDGNINDVSRRDLLLDPPTTPPGNGKPPINAQQLVQVILQVLVLLLRLLLSGAIPQQGQQQPIQR